MGDEQRPLLREVVVEVRDSLDGHVGLARPWGSNDEREARLHAGSDGLHLGGGEGDCIPEGGRE